MLKVWSFVRISLHIHVHAHLYSITCYMLNIHICTSLHLHVNNMYCISSNRRPGVYFLRDSADPAFKRGRRLFSCPRPPTLSSARRGQNSLQFVRPYGKPRERQAHSIAFNLKDTSKYLFCAIGVAVGEVQLSPFESTAWCTWTTCHAPKLVLGRPSI